MTEGDTRDRASRSWDRSVGDTKRPSVGQASSKTGAQRTGSIRIKGLSGASLGIGLRAKEQVRIRPRRPAGWSAAIEIAIGPENDSANRMNGFLFGRRERAIPLSAA